MPAANIGLPQWGLTCFYETFVFNQSAVLRLNICAKNAPLRQARKPLAATLKDDTADNKQTIKRQTKCQRFAK